MSWSAITADEVLEEFTPAEKASINVIQGAATNLEGVLARVVNAWRGSIVAGGNPLGAEDTIPDQVREDVIAEARWRWLISLPHLKSLQTEARKELYNDAKERREKIEAGETRTEIPATPITTPTQANAVSRPRAGRSVCTTDFDKLSST